MSEEIVAAKRERASSHTSGRIEIVSQVSGRRRWTVDQKLAMLRDAFGPGGSVRTGTELHEIGSGSLYTWRRQAMSGALTGVAERPTPSFAEVQISGSAVTLPPPTPMAGGTGRIEIELPSGMRLTLDASVDADAL